MSFRHVDHVELAWRLLGERSFDDAFAELERRLMALATAAGRPEKYDAAMTRAYLQIIDERRRTAEEWPAFVARNRDLFADGAALVSNRKFADANFRTSRASIEGGKPPSRGKAA